VNLVEDAKVDRTVLVVAALGEGSDERAYWRERSPEERLRAVELMRQVIYGYDPSAARLQRVLAVADAPRG
jgi:hypothetical protein